MLKPRLLKITRNFLWISAVGCQFSFSGCDQASASQEQKSDTAKKEIATSDSLINPVSTVLDTAAYNASMAHFVNGDTSGLWPVKKAPMPLAGAVLPFKRIIAYYGNLYSKQMGILGELPEDQMVAKLMGEVRKWEKADTTTKVQPALHYIAVTAQVAPGAAGKYRLRMPFTQIDKVLAMAAKIDAIVFLDIQVGKSTLQSEVPEFEKYLKMPNVHLGIDPEFSMKTGHAPGKVVGTFDAADINYTIDYLKKIVQENNIPPKILIVHRFTGPMVTNSSQIKPQAEVQVVMHMDGWGEAERKIGTYKHFIYPQPVQFTGFKIFYKNDTKKVNRTEVMQPEQLLKLKPRPLYIQYQ